MWVVTECRGTRVNPGDRADWTSNKTVGARLRDGEKRGASAVVAKDEEDGGRLRGEEDEQSCC